MPPKAAARPQAPTAGAPRLSVVGVGLMGASLAAALKAAGFVSHVRGCDENPAALRHARDHGLIDHGVSSLREAADADIVVLATPVGPLPDLLAQLKAYVRPATVITDLGSVKGPVARAAEDLGLTRCVPGHPIAGAERTGPGAARVDLFRGRTVVLTPFPGLEAAAQDLVRALWEAVGARVIVTSPDEHDRALAQTSHLPHLLAFACAEHLAQPGTGPALAPFVGTGLRDFLRIAGSDPVIWRDIFAANAAFLAPALRAYGTMLAAYGRALDEGDWAGLEARLGAAQAYHDCLMKEAGDGNR